MRERFEPGRTFEETYPNYPFSRLVGAAIRVAEWFAQRPPAASDEASRRAFVVTRRPHATCKPPQVQTTSCDLSGWGGPLRRSFDAADDRADGRFSSIYLRTHRQGRQI